MGEGTVLSLFDYTTAFVRPWAEAGYDCLCLDIQHPAGWTVAEDGYYPDATVMRWGGDIHDWKPEHVPDPIAFVAAFPPCTDLAVSGARWFKSKGLRALIDALDLVDIARQWGEASGAPWFLENPVSTISTYWRKPDHVFDPYEYGGYPGGEDDGYTKRTCLWSGGGFVMPERKPIPLADDHDRIHKAAPGPGRANFRSATPAGFARAVFEANRDPDRFEMRIQESHDADT